MAAWEGNVDRYARFMHPRRLRTETEYNCILRGFYHSTGFARWWAYQLETNSARIILPGKSLSEGKRRSCREIRTAINARKIMNNEISGIDEDSDCLSWPIWWPVKSSHSTCIELARKCPSMRHQIAITCVICDYEELFQHLKPAPLESLFVAARRSENPLYKDLEGAGGRDIEDPEISNFNDFDAIESSLQIDLEPRRCDAYSSVGFSDMYVPWGEPPRDYRGFSGIYGGLPAQAGIVERYILSSLPSVK